MNNLKIIADKTTLVDLVEEKLLGYFKNQNLKPGDSIPTELELTVALGVGRSVLREALSRFRMLGLIQSRTRRGMILSEPDMLGGLNKVVEPNIMSIESIKDILGLRIALEIGNSYLIIKHITDEDLLELEKIVMNYSASKYNKFTVDADHAFHSKLHEISRNKLISRYQEIFYKVFVFVNENYKKYFKIYNKSKSEDEFVTHKDLLEALKERDLMNFQRLMQKHLEIYSDFIDS
jgi:DNA-binding FadR family transcriptional regulator